MVRTVLLPALAGGALVASVAVVAPTAGGTPRGGGDLAAAPATTSDVITKTFGARARAEARTFWTAERMSSAKPVMPSIKKTAATRRLAARPDGGTAVTIAPAAPRGTATSAAPAPTSVVDPAIHGRVYAYPAPFTRFETFPAASYRVFPNKVVGKLFFSNAAGSTFVCSASVVNSENKDVVWTAGHCVSDGAGTFYRNFRFVPARRLGVNPFGIWTPRSVSTLTQWHGSGNLRQDVAALVMRNNARGASIANAVGALGIQFNATRVRSWNAMGYPAAAPFAGERQYQNIASYAASDTPTDGPGPDTIGIGNDLTGGSSGGPWVVGYSKAGGWVNSVNSYKYVSPAMPLEMYGPYFGNEALALYNAVRSG
jgi:V8-like Glu-specific endopeptidase